jgi:hypothetical protein
LTRSIPRRCEPTSQIAISGEALQAIELQKSTRRLYEGLKSLDGCLTQQEPALAFCIMTPDLVITTMRAISPLAQLRPQLDGVPHQPVLVSTAANQNEGRCFLQLSMTCGWCGTDDSTTPTTSVAILGLLQQIAALSLSGAPAKHAAFTPLALSQLDMRWPQPSCEQASSGGESVKEEAMLRQ